ncbi:MAG: ribbon-helix-helix protein, CopG family [Micromonosporaceae bacterium]
MANRRAPRFVGVWLSEADAAAIESRAHREKLTKSELLRRMLAYALRMPKGWKP